MTPRRVVFCWLHPHLDGWQLQQYAYLRMAHTCARFRLYPGPGTVAAVAGPSGIRDAAHVLAVPPHVLAQAVQRTTPGLWVDPLVAVATHVRDLNEVYTLDLVAA
jgi:hypothetical protein